VEFLLPVELFGALSLRKGRGNTASTITTLQVDYNEDPTWMKSANRLGICPSNMMEEESDGRL